MRQRAMLFTVMVAAFPFIGCKKDPKPVNPNDGVRCCFSVPYEGLNGQTINDKQCKVDLVCPKPSDTDTDDVCKPLACKAGDLNPYGLGGPGGASAVSGNCTVDSEPIEVIPNGCPVQEGGAGGAGTDQPPPPPPAPGDASGADSSGT